MDLSDVLNGLRARAPWITVARPLLLDAGFVIERGFEKTIRKALSEPKNDDRTTHITAALKEHLVAGEKLIRIIKLSAKERKTLEDWALNKRVSSSKLTDAFPGVASRTDITALQNSAPQSVGSIDLTLGTAALFTRSGSYLHRVEVPPSQLKDGNAHDYEKLIGVQRVFVQAYDAVWIPSAGEYACLVTDLPDGAPSDFADTGQIALEAHVRKVIGRTVEVLNLWPAVDGLYTSKDGRLTNYGFVTDTESVKHHKSHRGKKCLRDDKYDKAGAGAVGDDLVPFKIAMAWQRKSTKSTISNPEILLPGVAKLLGKTNASLDHAILRHCLNSGDLHFVVSKLLPHL